MRARGIIYRGGALVLSERFAEAVALLEEGIADTRTMRAVWLLPFYGGALASAYHRIGRGKVGGARALDEVLALTRQTRVEWAKAELERLEAGSPFGRGPEHASRRGMPSRAIATAQRQGAKWWELRAAVSLAPAPPPPGPPRRSE